MTRSLSRYPSVFVTRNVPVPIEPTTFCGMHQEHQAPTPPTTHGELATASEQGLYQAGQEHDACGVGFVAHIKGHKAHSIVAQGLKILENLDHRGAVGADKLMGDGAGILIQIPDEYYRAEMAAQGVELPPPGEYGVGMAWRARST